MELNNHDAHCIDWYRRLVADGTAEDGQRIAVALYDENATLIAEVERLNEACETACATAREYCDRSVSAEKQIATLKGALKLACEDQTEFCPYSLHGGKRKCSEEPMRWITCAECAPRFYIQKAQEQEGKSRNLLYSSLDEIIDGTEGIDYA